MSNLQYNIICLVTILGTFFLVTWIADQSIQRQDITCQEGC